MRNWSLKKKGYTLGELIVVMAIVGIIAAIGLNTYGKQRELTRFNDSLSKTLSIIQTARTYASTSRSAYDTAGILNVPREGYGVYFNKTNKQVILFANVKAGTDQEKNIYNSGSGNDTIEETYTLPDNVNLERFLDGETPFPTDKNEAVIIFRPPLADVTITDNNALTLTSINTLRLQFSRVGAESVKKFIRINKTAGFPEIEL
jgi:prepilin-type N-terminal cleavage/methylation domain-containing protein